MNNTIKKVIAAGTLGAVATTLASAVDFTYNDETFRDYGNKIIMLRSEDNQPSNYQYIEKEPGHWYFDANNSGKIDTGDIQMNDRFGQAVTRARNTASAPRRIPVDGKPILEFDYFSPVRKETNKFTLWSDGTATMGDEMKGEEVYRFVPGWAYDVDKSGTYTAGDEMMGKEFNIDFTQTIVDALIKARDETETAQEQATEMYRSLQNMGAPESSMDNSEELAVLKTDLATARTNVQTWQTKYDALERQYNTLKDSSTNASNIASLESQLGTVKSQLAEKERQYTRLEEEYEEFAKTASSRQTATPQVPSNNTLVTRTITPTTQIPNPTQTGATIEPTDYAKRLATLNSQIELYTAQIEAYKLKVGGLETNLAETQDKFDEFVRLSGERNLESNLSSEQTKDVQAAELAVKKSLFGLAVGGYHSFALGTPEENFWAAEIGATFAPLNWLKLSLTGIAGIGKEFSVTETGEPNPRTGVYGKGTTTTSAANIFGGAFDAKLGWQGDNIGFFFGAGFSLIQRKAMETIAEGTYNADGSERNVETLTYTPIKELSITPRLVTEIFFNKAGFGLEAIIGYDPKLKNLSTGLRVSTK